jgi:putative membrane protein
MRLERRLGSGDSPGLTVPSGAVRGVLVAAGVLLVRALARPSDGRGRPSPEQPLAERYARGEIDEDEQRRRLATLTGNDRTTQTP